MRLKIDSLDLEVDIPASYWTIDEGLSFLPRTHLSAILYSIKDMVLWLRFYVFRASFVEGSNGSITGCGISSS
jgi:hypothetical protein